MRLLSIVGSRAGLEEEAVLSSHSLRNRLLGTLAMRACMGLYLYLRAAVQTGHEYKSSCQTISRSLILWPTARSKVLLHCVGHYLVNITSEGFTV